MWFKLDGNSKSWSRVCHVSNWVDVMCMCVRV